MSSFGSGLVAVKNVRGYGQVQQLPSLALEQFMWFGTQALDRTRGERLMMHLIDTVTGPDAK